MIKKSNPMRLLEQARIPFEPLEYDGEEGRLDGASIAARLGIPPHTLCKTLITATPDKKYAAFVIPVSTGLDLKAAARAAGANSLAMLPQAQLFPLTGYLHGGCSPLGLKKPLPVFIDSTIEPLPLFSLNGGRIGLLLTLAPRPLAALLRATFAPLARPNEKEREA